MSAANSYDLKNEDEAKEYLEKVGIEYRFQCYHEKLPDGCHRLASFLESINKDFKKAKKVYEFNCTENKHGTSCFKLGLFQMTGKGGEKDVNKSFESFKRGCQLKDGASCHNLALMHQEGKTPEKRRDMKMVEELLRKGCHLNDLPSCFRLSGLYINGNSEVPRDMQKAFKYSLICCQRDNPYACSNISRMYMRGEGVQKDEVQGRHFKKMALNLQESTKQASVLSGG